MQMKRPKRHPNQYAVVQADYGTGHVLKIDKTVYLNEGEVFLIFDSQNEAMEYMEKTVKENPDIECSMENSLGEHVLTIDKNGERKFNH